MAALELKKHPSFGGVKGPVVLVVMDGVGCGAHDDGDAVFAARTPQLQWLAANGLYTELRAHGRAVGLPSDDDMGNSEVGHNAMGAGRVFDQGAKRVNEAIDSGEMFRSPLWSNLVTNAREHRQPMHFLGLLSDGNVHSHMRHLVAMIEACDREHVDKVRVHVLLDGRDVPETSALQYVDALEKLLGAMRDKGRDYWIASGGGRMKITMDRYNADWAMVARGWKAHVHGEARPFRTTAEAIETFRDEAPRISDQNLPAFVIVDETGAPRGPIHDGASVVLFNFRGDRAIEITRAFEDATMPMFERGARPDVLFAGMMQYDGDLSLPKHFLVPPPVIDRTLGEYMVRAGVSILACSETQKFGHVTYFWNGNRSGRFDEQREHYIEVPSDRLPFEERPWMKSAEITDVVIEELLTGKYRHARLNYANGDMVGHTGAFESSVLAVEAVDLALGRLIPVIEKMNGALIVTADHGNADEMFEMDKKSGAFSVDAVGRKLAKTSHSLNPVPFYVYAPGTGRKLDPGVVKPGLSNVAATTLTLLGLERPDDYDSSLIG